MSIAICPATWIWVAASPVLCPSSPDSSRTRRDFVGYRSETRKSGFNLTSRNTLHIWTNRRLRAMLGVRLLRIWRLRRQQGPSHQASGSGFQDLEPSHKENSCSPDKTLGFERSAI